MVAINFTGTTNGPDQTFITPDAPTIGLTFFSAVGQSTAHLGARVAGNTKPTDVRFEYGTSPAYGASTAPVPVGSDLFANETGADVGGLAPGTTYHFRAVATNSIGTTYGPDQTFTTVPKPEAVTTTPNPECRKGFVARRGKCVRRKCKKGFVKKRGKCVKRKRRDQHRSGGRRHG